MLGRVDTQRAYERIREQIVSLELAPGTLISEQELAEQLSLGLTPVREALQWLAHDDLVVVSPRHGLYVADVNLSDLKQISELRTVLEALSARLAAQRATQDDLDVLDVLRQESSQASSADARYLLELDHRFHRAVALAAHNKYLEHVLEHFFALSQRLWYLVLPELDFLANALEKHLKLVDAIRIGDAENAEQIMRDHVHNFYARVHRAIEQKRLD